MDAVSLRGGRRRAVQLATLLSLSCGIQTFASKPAESFAPPSTLQRMQVSRRVRCGLVKEEEDYTRAEDHGNRAAFDIDLCRAVTIAAAGPDAQLVLESFPDQLAALTALQSGDVDLVATASPQQPETQLRLHFSAPVLHDFQSILVPVKAHARFAADLAERRVCFLTGSAAEEGLHAFAEAHGLSFIWYPFSEAGEMEAAFFTGNCEAITGNVTMLANIRSLAGSHAADYAILPESFRDDPLAVATRREEHGLSEVVDLTLQTLRASVSSGERLETAPTPLLVRGSAADATPPLRPQWREEVLRAVGTYDELFERDLGAHSTLLLPNEAKVNWRKATPVAPNAINPSPSRPEKVHPRP